MSTYSKTARLMQRGADFLGSETAILCGAMSWVSERSLVSAISNAGGFGLSIESPLIAPPCNFMSPSQPNDQSIILLERITNGVGILGLCLG